MENAASQAMARKRRPVRCRNCGYVTTPVSGFCPNCLEPLPLGRRVGVVPIAVLVGLVALGAAVFAASSTGSIALRPAASETSPSSSLSSANPSPTATQSGPTVAQSTSPSGTTPASSAAPSSSPAASAPSSSNPAASASPSAPGPSPKATDVLGNQTTPIPSGTLPSTATSPGTAKGGTRYL